MIIHESEKVSIHRPVHGMIVRLYDGLHIQVYFDESKQCEFLVGSKDQQFELFLSRRCNIFIAKWNTFMKVLYKCL